MTQQEKQEQQQQGGNTTNDQTQEPEPKGDGPVLPKIFIFVNNVMDWGILGAAIAEDGTGLGSHLSSHEGFLRHDMGLTSDWKRDLYSSHYPDGYELVDVIDVEGWQTADLRHSGFAGALARADERASAVAPRATGSE